MIPNKINRKKLMPNFEVQMFNKQKTNKNHASLSCYFRAWVVLTVKLS